MVRAALDDDIHEICCAPVFRRQTSALHVELLKRVNVRLVTVLTTRPTSEDEVSISGEVSFTVIEFVTAPICSLASKTGR